MNKKTARLRRAAKTRFRIRKQRKIRLCVTRSSNHISAQLISEDGGRVLASASTQEKVLKDKCDNKTGNIAAATVIGNIIAERGKAAGVATVAFDRSGFVYHGRVKALADAARAGGLDF